MRCTRIGGRRERDDGAQPPVEHLAIRRIGPDGTKPDIDDGSQTARVHKLNQQFGLCRHAQWVLKSASESNAESLLGENHIRR
jgi:hypothetical protein